MILYPLLSTNSTKESKEGVLTYLKIVDWDVKHDKKHKQNYPRKYIKVGDYQPTSETPFERRFAGGPIKTQDCMQLIWFYYSFFQEHNK